jgi:hypothetical protein
VPGAVASRPNEKGTRINPVAELGDTLNETGVYLSFSLQPFKPLYLHPTDGLAEEPPAGLELSHTREHNQSSTHPPEIRKGDLKCHT